MSDAVNELSTNELITRITRMNAETAKFVEESQKLLAERGKLVAEQEKLAVEAAKLRRDHLLAPALAITGLVGGIITIVGFILQHLGVK